MNVYDEIITFKEKTYLKNKIIKSDNNQNERDKLIEKYNNNFHYSYFSIFF